MGTSGWNVKYSFVAAEDLHKAPQEGIAIALNDRKTANDGGEACGVLESKPKSGEHGSIALFGITKARAGMALTAGLKLTVSTSGYFTQAYSATYHCGRALEAITSGSLGPIFFHGAGYYQTSL